MSTRETIEYFDDCPNCGAVSDHSGVCPYCGTSMIKNRTVTEYNLTLEEEMRQEDRYLPLRKVKSGKVSGFMKLFCPLFGGIFLLVPTGIFSIFIAAGIMEPWLLLFFGVFWIIGLGALVPFFAAIIGSSRCKNGQQIFGTVRGYSNSAYTINGNAAKTIRIRLESRIPEIIEFDTGDSETPYAIGQRVSLRTDGTRYMIE